MLARTRETKARGFLQKFELRFEHSPYHHDDEPIFDPVSLIF